MFGRRMFANLFLGRLADIYQDSSLELDICDGYSNACQGESSRVGGVLRRCCPHGRKWEHCHCASLSSRCLLHSCSQMLGWLAPSVQGFATNPFAEGGVVGYGGDCGPRLFRAEDWPFECESGRALGYHLLCPGTERIGRRQCSASTAHAGRCASVC